ncbi:hypothetical protein ACIREM_27110 [Streptomyces shenzhenensis]|uniref:hypothetical protein n=1 Tax=Streptomyces shenzhenensis TaxID=943815 RepID=UPI00380C11D2
MPCPPGRTSAGCPPCSPASAAPISRPPQPGPWAAARTAIDASAFGALLGLLLAAATMLGCVSYPWTALHSIRRVQVLTPGTAALGHLVLRRFTRRVQT